MTHLSTVRPALIFGTLLLGFAGVFRAMQMSPPQDELPAAVRALVDSARASFTAGLYRDAEDALAQGMKQLGPGDDPARAVVFTAMGDVQYAEARYDEAATLYQAALSIEESRGDRGQPFAISNLIKLGQVHSALGRTGEAEEYFQRAILLGEAKTDQPAVALAANNLASLYRRTMRLREAEQYYRTALRIDSQILAPNDPAVANDLDNLALLYADMGDKKKAEELLLNALRLRERRLGSDNPALAESLLTIARLRVSLGEPAAAEPYYERLLAIDEKIFGPDHPRVANVLAELGKLYYQEGSYERARIAFARAIAIEKKAYGSDNAPIANLAIDLAHALDKLGRTTEARGYRDRAAKIHALAASEPPPTGPDK